MNIKSVPKLVDVKAPPPPGLPTFCDVWVLAEEPEVKFFKGLSK